MKNCRIFRNPNTDKITKVEAPNGKPSILYNAIKYYLPDSIKLDKYIATSLKDNLIRDNSNEEIALAIWSKVYTNTFKQRNGDWLNRASQGITKVFSGMQNRKVDRVIQFPKDLSVELDINGEPLYESIGESLFTPGDFKIESNNYYYNLTNKELSDVSPNLEIKLYNFLTSIGANVKYVDSITDREGNPINAFGKASIMKGLIELVNNERGVNSLPEEAAHMITGLLGVNHPLMKQMMNKITSYDVYDEVKTQYAGVYTTEQEFKFEAVGKLIAKHIINEEALSQSQRAEAQNWFSRLLTYLRRQWSKTDTSVPKEAIDEFKMIASALVTDNNNNVIDKLELSENLKKKKGLKGEFYNIKESPTQDTISNKFIESANRLLGMVKVEGKPLYQLTDKILSRRVSMIQDALFARFKSPEQVKEMNENPSNKNAAEMGTVLHDYNEQQVNYVASHVSNIEIGNSKKDTSKPVRPPVINSAHEFEINRSLEALVKGISAQQSKIDENGKVKIFTENFVIDDNKDEGGSQDLTIVYSDGSVSIYDYKFIQFKEDKTISPLKEQSFDLQLSRYKEILNKVYGVTKFRAIRILPFNIKHETEKGIPTGRVFSIEGFKVEKDYLMPLPVAKELTQNPEINKMLSDLFKRQKSLTDRYSKSFQDPDRHSRIGTELGLLRKSIKYIQVLNDFEPLVNSINATLTNMANVINDIDIYGIESLNRMDAEIKLFKGLYDTILNETSNKELIANYQVVSSRLSMASSTISQKRLDLLLNENEELSKIQKEIEATEAHFSYLSMIDHPAFETANKYLKTLTGNVNRATLKLHTNLKGKTDKLESWAKSKGLTLWEAFDKIISDKGTLINELSKEFYTRKKQAIADNDVKWLQETHSYTVEGKAKYKQAFEEYKAFLKTMQEEGTDMYKWLLESWVKKNDLSSSTQAWTNNINLWKYTEIINKEKFYSTEYRELQVPGNSALKEYYDFYMETNKELNMLVGEKIGTNFIANVKKDWIEAFSERGGDILKASTKMKEDFKKSFQTQQHEEMISDGDVDIPLLFYSPTTKKENGKWVKSNELKSKDLSESLQLFAESVYRKHELTKVKGILEALQLHLNEQEVMLTNGMGKIKRYKYTGEIAIKASTTNAEIFSKHMRAYVYGERLQNKDVEFMEKYSMNKTLTNIMTMFSVNTLALNYVSAAGNVGAGTANAFIKGVGGRYYNNKQLKKAMRLAYTRGEGDIYNYMTEYFKIESESWNRKLAQGLSASKLSQNMTTDKAFTLWQKGDDFVSNIVLVAMSQNYGIDPKNGLVRRLELLPEGTKSIKDNMKITDKKIESGLTNTQFDDFRRMVSYISRQIKGSNTTEEMSIAQMTVFGKMYMFFKNWLPPMASERFGAIKYTADLKEFEYGRFRSVMKEATKGYFLKNLPKLLLNLATINKLDTTSFETQFEKYIEMNPHMEGKINVEDYIELRRRSIREGLYELRLVTSIALLMLIMAMDWDDDGKSDYKQYFATRQLYGLLKRTHLELSFFSNPLSVTQIIQNPIPLISVGTGLVKWVQNTGDETFKAALGIEDPRDKTPFLHETKKMSGFKHMFKLVEDWEANEDDD